MVRGDLSQTGAAVANRHIRRDDCSLGGREQIAQLISESGWRDDH